MTIDTATPRSRRAILAAALGGVAATAANALGRPAAALATDNQPILQGATNTGTLSTVVAVANTTALQGVTDATSAVAYGVRGRSTSTAGVGVVGQVTAATGLTYGVLGISASTGGAGLKGTSPAAGVRGEGGVIGVLGEASGPGGAGVYGQASNANSMGVYGSAPTGVSGFSGNTNGIGVRGSANFGSAATGVDGLSNPGYGVRGRTQTGVGVQAESSTTTGVGLKVIGTASFSRSGKATILAGQSAVTVSGIPLTASSLVFTTILGGGATGVYVRNVSINTTASRFYIKLSKGVTANTVIGWFVVN